MNIKDQKPIISAILLAAVIIAGAILLKDSQPKPGTPIPITGTEITGLPPIGSEDRIMGDINAKITLVMYEDFQCPFCARFYEDAESNIRNTYVQNGDVALVYRDYAFLGPESQKSAEAARCAGEQGKFWEYHDYLFDHHNGENQGTFSDPNLKSFAQTLALNTSQFDTCLDSGKYTQAVMDETNAGTSAGVEGTPKGFILKDGKVVATIDGAEPYAAVKAKIDNALK